MPPSVPIKTHGKAGTRRTEEASLDPSGSPEYLVASQLRNELLADTTERGRRTIQNIWLVCEEMFCAGESITVAEVGRRLDTRFGGPKAQSIRDQPERLKRLVDLCAEIGGRAKPLPAREEEGVLGDIRDQTVTARVRAMLGERDALRKEVTALRKAFQRLAPIDALSADQCYGPGPGGARGADAAAPAPHAFTPDEKAAVRKFLEANFLRDEGFRIDDSLGLLSDDTGRTILPPAFVRALRKIVGFTPSPGSEPKSLAAASGAPRTGLLSHSSSVESQ